MRRVLVLDGTRWWDREPASFAEVGTPRECGADWSYVVQLDRRKTFVVVLFRGEQQYRYELTRANRVLLTEFGAAELAVVDENHSLLAIHVLRALAHRKRDLTSVVVSFLARNESIAGVSIRTRPGARNIFTDGTIRIPSRIYNRMPARCDGGTFLVHVQRHSDLKIYGVEVTVQRVYNADALSSCLTALA